MSLSSHKICSGQVQIPNSHPCTQKTGWRVVTILLWVKAVAVRWTNWMANQSTRQLFSYFVDWNVEAAWVILPGKAHGETLPSNWATLRKSTPDLHCGLTPLTSPCGSPRGMPHLPPLPPPNFQVNCSIAAQRRYTLAYTPGSIHYNFLV